MRNVVTRSLGALAVCAVLVTLGTPPGITDEGYFLPSWAASIGSTWPRWAIMPGFSAIRLRSDEVDPPRQFVWGAAGLIDGGRCGIWSNYGSRRSHGDTGATKGV